MSFQKKTFGINIKRHEPTGTAKSAARFRRKLGHQILRVTALVAVFGLLAGSLTLVTLLAWFSKDLPNPDDLIARPIPQTTTFYDRTGTHVLYETSPEEKRTLVKLEEIPQYAKDATILLEDKTFYEHNGLSWQGMLRIAVNPVLCKVTANRFCTPGGSTITQQLVKNVILSNERSLSRKLKEILLTLEIERRYSKNQILQLYFNEIAYGSTNYGIEAASQSYFGKSAKDLSIAEAATLAALPRSPTSYLNNHDRLKSRRDYALSLLRDAGKITDTEYETARRTAVEIHPHVSNIGDAPHFVFYVKEQLTKLYGEREVEQGGLKITTTLDYDKQKIAQEEVKKGVETNGPARKYSNAALVAIDPKTGQVLAMVGSKDYFAKDIDGNFNVATSPNRQPGSSMKPIIYAAAFMKGYTPDTVLWDVETTFPVQPQTYTPHDYDLKERGPVTLRTALQGSLNIPAVKLLYLVGLDRALEFAKELGYTTLGDSSKYGLSLVLGGGSVELVEHVNAYATFADEGIRHPLASILTVEKPNGEKLYEWTDQPYRAMDENIARTVSNVLSDNNARAYVFGATSPLQLGNRPVAAKTGTTNDYVDAWTVGYTPSLAAGVWAGNNDNSPMNRAGGSLAAAPIWNAFMKRALNGTAVENFTPPEPLPEPKPVLAGYHVDVPLNSNGTPGPQPTLALNDGTTVSNYGLCTPATVDKASGMLATEFTPETFRETRYFCELHEILQYVKKDDPTGAPPENPAKEDPLYQPFEDGITKWLTTRGVTAAAPPVEHDTVHRPELRPLVNLLSPAPGTVMSSRSARFEATASAARPISRVEFWMDNVKLGSAGVPPYVWSGTIPNRVGPGEHQAKAIAYDDLDNNAETSAKVQLTAPIIPIIVTMTWPAPNTIFKAKSLVNVKVQSDPGLQALDLLFTKEGAVETLAVTALSLGPQTTIPWVVPDEKGKYAVRVRGREEGEVYHWSETVSITVY